MMTSVPSYISDDSYMKKSTQEQIKRRIIELEKLLE